MSKTVHRQHKTPQQRAQEALDLAERHVARLAAKRHALRADLDVVQAEHDAAVARRDYLKAHPDLGPTRATTTQPGTTSTGDNT